MAIWFGPKGKTYVGTGENSWLKSYVDYLNGKNRDELTDHCEGRTLRHHAESILYGENQTVGSALTETEKRLANAETAQGGHAEQISALEEDSRKLFAKTAELETVDDALRTQIEETWQREFHEAFTTLEDAKQDKDTIVTEVTGDTLVLEENQDARLGETESLVLSVPENISERYRSTFSFQSGEKATSLVYGHTPLQWNGDDVNTDGQFVPEPFSTYEVNAKTLGRNGIRARVGKVAGYNSVDVEGSVLRLPNSAGKALRDYKIYGNTVHESTVAKEYEENTYYALEDSYVHALKPSSNFDGEERLVAKYHPDDTCTVYRAAYIKFAVPDITEETTEIMLRFKANIEDSQAESNAFQDCYLATSDSDWSASTLTYENRPKALTHISTFKVRGTALQYYTLYVTDAVHRAAARGDKEITFVFLGGADYITKIHSCDYRYEASRPALVVSSYSNAYRSVGDFNEETGTYDIPVTVHGKNLIPFKSSYVVDKLAMRLDEEEVVNAFNTLKPGTYTMSYTATLTEIDEETYLSGDHGGILLRFGTRDIWLRTGSWDNCPVGTTRQRSTTFALTEEDITSGIQAVYGYGCMHFSSASLGYSSAATGTAEIYNIQLEAGDVATEYVPYVEPKTTVISLFQPLRMWDGVADYIDFKNGYVVQQIFYTDIYDLVEGQEWFEVGAVIYRIDLPFPEIYTDVYDIVITVDTTVPPSNLKATYYKKG